MCDALLSLGRSSKNVNAVTPWMGVAIRTSDVAPHALSSTRSANDRKPLTTAFSALRMKPPRLSCEANPAGDERSTFDRQHRNTVLVSQLAAAHRVLELHAEHFRRANAALGGERAAEHDPAGVERIAPEQIFRGAHRGDRAFLVELAIGPGAQDEALPMVFYVVVAPSILGDRLGAELLRERHADGFRFAVGVIGADGDPEAIGSGEQHELHFTARVGARDLDRARLRKEIGSDAVEDRRCFRCLDAELLELANVLAQR